MKNTPETKIYYFADGKIYHLSLEDYLKEYFPEKWGKGFDSAFYAATNGMTDAPPFYEDLAELYEGMGYEEEDCQFMASTTFFEGISAKPALRFLAALENCFNGINPLKDANEHQVKFTLSLLEFMNCVKFHQFLELAQNSKVLPFIEGIFICDYQFSGGNYINVSVYEYCAKYLVDITV